MYTCIIIIPSSATTGAQGLAVKTWVQAISIAFTKTYTLINRSTAPGCGPELLHTTLLGTLQLVAGLSSRGQMGLAAELAGCCRCAFVCVLVFVFLCLGLFIGCLCWSCMFDS